MRKTIATFATIGAIGLTTGPAVAADSTELPTPTTTATYYGPPHRHGWVKIDTCPTPTDPKPWRYTVTVTDERALILKHKDTWPVYFTDGTVRYFGWKARTDGGRTIGFTTNVRPTTIGTPDGDRGIWVPVEHKAARLAATVTGPSCKVEPTAPPTTTEPTVPPTTPPTSTPPTTSVPPTTSMPPTSTTTAPPTSTTTAPPSTTVPPTSTSSSTSSATTTRPATTTGTPSSSAPSNTRTTAAVIVAPTPSQGNDIAPKPTKPAAPAPEGVAYTGTGTVPEQLPDTGGDGLAALIAGSALVAGGAVLLVAARKQRAS